MVARIIRNQLFFGLVSIFFVISAQAQREANIWYFGKNVGLDFNSGFPKVLHDSQMQTWEGSACYSDTLGNLLFYTDGTRIWDKTHRLMPNGTNLWGDSSSTESAIVIPQPETDSLYYVFTVDYQARSGGLSYSVVNLKLNNGNGDVTAQKNVQLLAQSPEKVTAVKHANNHDIWVIAHGWATDTFFTYKVTKNGLDTNPVISEVGLRHTTKAGNDSVNALGYMRASPKGNKVAVALFETSFVEIFDFDNQTGELSNPIAIFMNFDTPYGVEFSPSGEKLYITSGLNLYQVNLSAETNTDIINSVTKVAVSPDSEKYFGALQLATDGYIYVAQFNNDYISRIEFPEKLAPDCQFEFDAVYLEGKKMSMGLPNFIQSLFIPPSFRVENACENKAVGFYLTGTSVDSVWWNFGDGNTSKILNPTHHFDTAGRYQIHLTTYKNNAAFHEQQIIQINPKPPIELGKDTFLCSGTSLRVSVPDSTVTLLWSDNETDTDFITSENEKIYVQITSQLTGCQNSDTINAYFVEPDALNLGNDTTVCYNDTLRIEINSDLYKNVEWNNNLSGNSIDVLLPGNYYADATDTLGCAVTDTIRVSHFPKQHFSLGNDTTICAGSSYRLNILDNFTSVEWNIETTNPFLDIGSAGTYWNIAADTNGCLYTDSIEIMRTDIPTFYLPTDTSVCEGEFLVLDYSNTKADAYLWSDGSALPFFETGYAGNYSLQLSNKCGSATKQMEITYKFCGQLFFPNVVTPNNDGMNDFFYINGLGELDWTLEVFSRQGKRVFFTENYKNNWDLETLNPGIYFYTLQNTDFDLKYTGFFHLYR